MSSIEFLGITIAVAGELANRIYECAAGMAWAEIVGLGRPSSVRLTTTAAPKDGTTALAVNYGRAERLTEAGYVLDVPVRWMDGSIPHTREKYKDNVDITLLEQDGYFTDVQAGLVTRHGRFFVTLQQVYQGWVTRTRGSRVGEVAWGFTPADPIHAFTGARYEAIWAKMAEELMGVAREAGASSRLSRVEPAEWAPPDVGPRTGWKAGVMRFYNLITGTGQVEEVSGGGEQFVHHSAILNSDGKPMRPFPALAPMTGVHFRLRDPRESRKPGEGPGVKSVMPAA